LNRRTTANRAAKGSPRRTLEAVMVGVGLCYIGAGGGHHA
jgi:hypothetical protein